MGASWNVQLTPVLFSYGGSDYSVNVGEVLVDTLGIALL